MAKLRHILRHQINKDMIDQLATNKAGLTDIKIFPTIRELLCFASVLGYGLNKKEKLPKGDQEDIQKAQWEANGSDDFIYLIGLADKSNMSVLEDENVNKDEDINTIFEEYAHAGLNRIKKWLNDYPQDIVGHEAIIRGLIKDKFLKVNNIVDQETRPIF